LTPPRVENGGKYGGCGEEYVLAGKVLSMKADN
jgi:hypothetical protein